MSTDVELKIRGAAEVERFAAAVLELKRSYSVLCTALGAEFDCDLTIDLRRRTEAVVKSIELVQR